MNKNVKDVEISGIRKFFNKVSKVDGAISLTLGQPDFPVPDPLKEAIIKALNEDKTQYTPNSGIYPLRNKISEYLATMNINYDAEEVCITVGGSEGLFSVLMAVLNKGDKVLIPNPSYPAYEGIANILGATVVNYSLKGDFSIDIEDLEKKLKDDVKAIVLSFPSNPTGAVLSKEDMQDLHNLLKKSSVTIITDEIYSSVIFNEEYYSIAQYEDVLDRVILVSGFSKMFSMTGLRVGYVCAKEKYMKEFLKVHQYNVSSAPSIVQWGLYEGFDEGLKSVSVMKNEFKIRRDYVYNRLQNMGLLCTLPQGAFYIFPSIKKFGLSSEEFCTKLLEEVKVACVPGSAFGSLGEGHIRISYCYHMDTLEKSLNILEEWLKQYNKQMI
ncbi:aminotransferase class I/II-fold pyridoxal phosphate-dependent enzyme [Clostridium sp. MSJ-4]|uniref:Aminotransferase class I/II-fold pyridoxal phosphate-dependent enzyme n=1 Tax=Clostridium simiarum TaxID=2841506 RepID=A0ABS6EWL1_9CLOT|nr:aminotransferase class I/II-fold pyridoxal phosphate-dependent enzyme [Clostridium simiarum]MBU5590614.1 aminotransferase class I/II-fold pyridoxal phosphate-dependent enzyme [Clostridium simiarum]